MRFALGAAGYLAAQHRLLLEGSAHVATTDAAGAQEHPPRSGHDITRTLTVVGFVLAVVAIVFAPLLIGGAAIVLGFVARARGDRLGIWVVVVGALGMLIGLLLGALVADGTSATAAATAGGALLAAPAA